MSGIHTTSLLDSTEKRKQERRSRVAAKIEDAKRQTLGIKDERPASQTVDAGKSRISSEQILKSKERLKKLVSDGYQLVTGVSVAGDSREIRRRQDEAEARKACHEKMEAEASASLERFDEIMRKWSDFKAEEVPQSIQSMLQQQKIAREEMLDEKNKVVSDFEEELKMKDEQYVKHLKKQTDDIDLLVERMEEQAHSLLKAFQEELCEIEKVFALERQQLVSKGAAAIQEATAQRSHKESEYLEIREKRISENEAKIKHLRVHSHEELNEIKIKLETDVQNLQQQIQQMKSTFHLNSEKLEYNFQVLKKRDEENIIIISQQKRKLTRLQDTFNNFRTKLLKQEKANKSNMESLVAEYQKNIEQYKDLQRKFKHFQLADAKRFTDIWQMNEENARKLANDVSLVDEHIHLQLGLEWQQKETISSPLQLLADTKMRKFSRATLFASQVFSASENDDEPVLLAKDNDAKNSIPVALMKQILQLIASEATFLIYSKLPHLLSFLGKEEQVLIILDSIFKALNINSESDVEEMMKFFVKFDDASNCNKCTLIDSNDIPHAFKRFTELRQPNLAKDASGMVEPLVDEGDVTTEALNSPFWSLLVSSIPEQHERMWTAIIGILENYHTILINRAKLIHEIQSMQQQNGELRLLLHQYMHSTVNSELQVPPVLMMPNALSTT